MSRYFELLKPLLDSDTKSHRDAIAINDYCYANSDRPDPQAEQLAPLLPRLSANVRAAMADDIASKMGAIAVLERGDGQSVITIANEKRLNPETFKYTVPCSGAFHSSGHFAFCGNEGFHDAKYGRTKDILHKEKVPKHIPNFENDTYLHCTTHEREDFIGTMAYLLLDVVNPPPELLLDDPLQYRSLICSAGGIAAFESIRHVGNVLAHWQLATRSGDGEKLCELEAYNFHCCRAWAHKPVEVRVMLISLLASQTTHPKVAEVVKQTSSFSWSANPGDAMACDRTMEMVNRVQDERRGKFAAFESALEFTPSFAAFLHVTHMLDKAENPSGETEASDPLRGSTINAAEVIRKDLRQRLGVDLTVRDNHNQIFHTGGAPNTTTSTNHLSHRPWEHWRRVADALSSGKGRGGEQGQGGRESWHAYVDRFLAERLWTSAHS